MNLLNLHMQARAESDTSSFFKCSVIDVNSDFSFSQTGCDTKVPESCIPYYLPIAREE